MVKGILKFLRAEFPDSMQLNKKQTGVTNGLEH
jgi:hypothetical protein